MVSFAGFGFRVLAFGDLLTKIVVNFCSRVFGDVG